MFEDRTMNSIFILYPKRSSFGVWSFDDDTRGLVNEPFVGETNKLLDMMAKESGYSLEDNPQVALLFSDDNFPESQCSLVLRETSNSGSTYIDLKRKLTPWLCPAMFKYFKNAPSNLFGGIVANAIN
jgi:hypothetical protein